MVVGDHQCFLVNVRIWFLLSARIFPTLRPPPCPWWILPGIKSSRALSVALTERRAASLGRRRPGTFFCFFGGKIWEEMYEQLDDTWMMNG